mmetsp:Transcript_27495/g.40624  ORF Transcript_27495/g.40624 Transcript_27495/m.40624 type:complete len:212 (+) Transcript_27495:444-1079(+)
METTPELESTCLGFKRATSGPGVPASRQTTKSNLSCRHHAANSSREIEPLSSWSNRCIAAETSSGPAGAPSSSNTNRSSAASIVPLPSVSNLLKMASRVRPTPSSSPSFTQRFEELLAFALFSALSALLPPACHRLRMSSTLTVVPLAVPTTWEALLSVAGSAFSDKTTAFSATDRPGAHNGGGGFGSGWATTILSEGTLRWFNLLIDTTL